MLAGDTGTSGWGIPAPKTGVPWTWGENDGTDGGLLACATNGAPTGYVPVVAGGAAGAGKLELKGFMAGGAAVELRFNETIPDSRPAKRESHHTFIQQQ